ncbi:sigma-70 family RNA polymerase sigma factor [Thermophilibacter sp. ET337]|uniref:RNA polymerase sigma factor n=1 Tax=Thermophilibacter sp. ET337 TaxID=2973084 RepID=UPI0021AD260C|nr:sigma-70 family RNA polymerase sigma factor [Thermophilibacter sp. ET337]MCR8907420.1 sigma-70 family RNA polymerase sigma factor [Thermophilibacter sp. ET337]
MRAKKRAVRLVNDYADLILRLSYTYLGSKADAEDVCQEVLLRLLGRAEAFEGPEHERAWVVRVTANRCKDLLRRRASRPTVALDEVAEPAAPETVDARVLLALVLRAVMRLPLEYREAIFLRYYENYSVRDIARVCGCSEDAAAARLSRGRAKLKVLLKEVGYDEEDL